MFYLRMALRNVFRQYGRNAFSMVSIIAGVALLIFGRGLIGGLKENIIRASVDTMTGHVMVIPADYPKAGIKHPVDDLLTLTADDEAWLDEHTTAWTRRTLFVPRAISGQDALRIRVVGFDPATDESVFPRRQWTVAEGGKIPETAADGLLIGPGIRRILGVDVGDRLILEVRTHTGAINALDVPIAGVMSMGNPMFDRLGAFAPQDLADQLIVNGDAFSHLVVRIGDRDDVTAFAPSLQERLGADARTRTWKAETQSIIDAQDLRQRGLDFMSFALLAIAATGIANTVLMAAYERVREIGTLRSMGMTRQGVVALFVAEGLIMGLVGSVIGAVLGAWANYYFMVHGIDMAPMIEEASKTGGYDGIPFSVMLYTEFSEPTILWGAVIGVLIAVLASIYPAVLASQLTPADAVRAA